MLSPCALQRTKQETPGATPMQSEASCAASKPVPLIQYLEAMHIPCIFPCIFPSFQYSSNRASGDMKLYETANITEFLLHLRCSISNHITNLSPTYHQPYLIELTITNHIPYSTKLHLIPPMNHHPNLWDLPGQIH